MSICDAMIHISENLPPATRSALEENMRQEAGVIAPRFGADKGHLLVVAYDPTATSAGTLLERGRDHGYHARLVGL